MLPNNYQKYSKGQTEKVLDDYYLTTGHVS